MNKKKIDINEYAGMIGKKLEKGVLLTTKAGDKVNSMVIGWGHVGRVWERPVFIAYVRDSRFTFEMLEKNPEFTVNVPLDGIEPKEMGILGAKSGRDMDKIAEAGLTLVPGTEISVPAVKEYPLTLECKVLYTQRQDASEMPDEIQKAFYTLDTSEHTVYYGEIVDAYLIED